MPSNSAKVKIRAVESYSAQVVFCEPTEESREMECAEVINKTGATLIHSFENEHVIAGQGTAAMELLEDIPDLDVIMTDKRGRCTNGIPFNRELALISRSVTDRARGLTAARSTVDQSPSFAVESG